MEKAIKSYVEDFEHDGMDFSFLVSRVAEYLASCHMVRTAERLTKMGELPALRKIYGMIGKSFEPILS